MIPTAGMSPLLAIRLVDQTRDRELERIAGSFEHKRAIESFEARIGKVVSVDDLMKDRELYVFVMKAFDLEDQIFGKALVSKILKSDREDRTSLVNKLTDPRFKEMHKTLDFKFDGTVNFNTLSGDWRDKMVSRYLETQFINKQSEQNPVVGSVLDFRRKVDGINNWFDVLKDKGLSIFMRTALGIPASAGKLDIDRQAAMFEAKMPLSKLKDPAEILKLERKYMIIETANNPQMLPASPIVSLVSSAAGGGSGWRPVTIDVGLIASIPKRPYY
jgi:hypothetical protein